MEVFGLSVNIVYIGCDGDMGHWTAQINKVKRLQWLLTNLV